MSRDLKPLLAFDFGLKRIGVATANRLTRTATPLVTLESGAAPPWDAIAGLIAAWQPGLIVVGHPGAGADAKLLTALEDFVAELERRSALTVERVDESLTSYQAEAELRAGRAEGVYNRRLGRGRIDSFAACLIAEQWMHETLERD